MIYANRITKTYLRAGTPLATLAEQNPLSKFQDPTFLGFFIRIERPVANDRGSFNSLPHGLFLPESDPDSAIAYLQRRGEKYRAECMRQFVKNFLELTEKMPWFFTSVTGVDALWKIDPSINFRAKDKTLEFETLESIDLKITFLMDLYRKAAFDFTYMRWMLPDTQRMFKMSLYVAEIRPMQIGMQNKVNSGSGGASSTASTPGQETLTKRTEESGFAQSMAGAGATDSKNLSSAFADGGKSVWKVGYDNNNASAKMNAGAKGYAKYPVPMSDFDSMATFMEFKLSMCEFDPFDTAPSFLTSLASSSAEASATNKMVIKFGAISESNVYSLLGMVVKDTLNMAQRENVGGDVKFTPEAPPASRVDQFKAATFNPGADNVTQNSAQESISKKAVSNPGGTNAFVKMAEDSIKIAAQKGEDYLKEHVNKALLGNVYGVSTATVLTQIGSAQGLIDAAKSVIAKTTTPGVSQAALGTVELVEPLVSQQISASNTIKGDQPSENLEGPLGTATGGGQFSSTHDTPPSANLQGNSQQVVLFGPPSSTLSTQTVNLEAPVVSSMSGDHVDLEAPTLSGVGGGHVDLEAPTVDQSNPGSVPLTGATPIDGQLGNVVLKEPVLDQQNPGKTSLEAPNQMASNPGKVNLESPTLNGSMSKKEPLEGPSIKLEGDAGSVELTSSPLPTTKVDKVNLDSVPVNTSMDPKVKLDSAPVNNAALDKITLEQPKVTEARLDKINLESSPIKEVAPGSVKLEGEAPANTKLGSLTLNGPKVNEHKLGSLELEGPDMKISELGKVNLEAPEIVKSDLGTIELRGSTIKTEPLQKVELVGPAIKDERLGQADMTAPETTGIVQEKADTSGVKNKLIAEDLGNSGKKNPAEPI